MKLKDYTQIKPWPSDSPLRFMDMNVIVSPDVPVLKLSDKFEYCSDSFREAFNLWLVATFGTRNMIPKDTIYFMAGMQSFITNPATAVKLTTCT